MNPYSHIVVASKLEPLVHPEHTQDYYWGAIAPDIRYPALMQREQTHIPSQRIIGFISQYPHLKSFLQGYLVHCLTDEIELGQILFQWFPFSVLKGKMSRQRMAVILELYHFENEKLNKTLSGSHNEVLSELGLNKSLSTRFSESISQYATSLSPESRLACLFELLGLENDSRTERYMAAARSFQKNWFLRYALFLGIRRGRISEQVVSRVASLYQQCDV